MGWTGGTVPSPLVIGKGMSHFPNGQSMVMLDMSATATQEAMPLFMVHTQITVHYLLAWITKINEY